MSSLWKYKICIQPLLDMTYIFISLFHTLSLSLCLSSQLSYLYVIYFVLSMSLLSLSFSLSACLALFHSLSAWVFFLLTWHLSTSVLPLNVCPESQTEGRCCLTISLESALSVAVFALILLFSFSLSVFLCLLVIFNSLVATMSQICFKS
ncbi:hypothetical protein ATANTOWER_012816 [Ataeniobius toweri]|uniref:NADH dehydrogenase subunit 6 n=1 Tax=Ataeniobius toweri TaxID=208326 RepID=A0ABU7AL49_9TELE|nr:hypothetical protein [Ataeniobius toweri]